jgi:hypothetical protein
VDDLDRLEPRVLHSIEQALASAKQDWNKVEGELFDRARRQSLARGRGAAGDGDLAVAGGCTRLLQGMEFDK